MTNASLVSMKNNDEDIELNHKENSELIWGGFLLWNEIAGRGVWCPRLIDCFWDFISTLALFENAKMGCLGVGFRELSLHFINRFFDVFHDTNMCQHPN